MYNATRRTMQSIDATFGGMTAGQRDAKLQYYFLE